MVRYLHCLTICLGVLFAVHAQAQQEVQSSVLFDTIPPVQPNPPVMTAAPATPEPVAMPVAAPAAAPVAAAPSAVIPAPLQTQLEGVTKTLMAYPTQSEAILSNYLGVDTTKIDFEKFDAMIANQNYQEIYDQVSLLSANRDAFNAGTFTNVAYYRVAPVLPPNVVYPQPIAPVPVASISTLAFAGGAVVAVAAGVAVAGSGGKGDSTIEGGTSPSVTDIFARNTIADTATPASFVDAEFTAFNQDALTQEKAQFAYAKGLTGNGVKIGFYDWFTNDHVADAELNSRVIYRNLDIVDDTNDLSVICGLNPGVPEACDHGSTVMQYAAGARNGVGTQGVAYEASLLMESVNASANARNLADQNPDILNFSCTGCASLADLQYIATKGILITSATGNSGGADPNIASPAHFADQFADQLLAVVGVYQSGGALSAAAYDKCGSQMHFCLSAYSDVGTSFAAPQVAGAAALIKDGWSFLTAQQIGQILLLSATDIGAVGVDPVFGHGLLNLQAAVQPIGSISALSGFGALHSFTPSTIMQNPSTAFGDAFANPANAKGNIVVVDSFGRDFNVTTQNNLVVSKKKTLSSGTLRMLGKQDDTQINRLNDHFAFQYSEQENDQGLTDKATMAEYDINPNAKIMMGFATDMTMVDHDQHDGFNKNNFIATDVFDNGYMNFSDNNQVFYQSVRLNDTQVLKTKFNAVYSKEGEMDYFKSNHGQFSNDYMSMTMENSFSPHHGTTLKLTNGLTDETDSVLGTKFSGGFELQGGNTYFTGLDASYDVRPDLNLSASYTYGVTKTKPGEASAFSSVSDLTSDSFFVTANKKELFGHDSLSFSVGQPLRVRSGYATGLTQSVDHNTGAVSTQSFQQSLVPSGRTMLFQAAYGKALGDDVNVNFALEYNNQPYQQQDNAAEVTGLAKIVYTFN